MRKTVKKIAWLCLNGPLQGHKLWLTNGTTAIFTINGQTGRYNHGEWEC
jgi:hypothetical protein